MPKPSSKRKSAVVSSDSDSGPDDVTPRSGTSSSSSSAKKAKMGQTVKVVVQPGGMSMDDGEPTWELGYNKKIKVRTFKGKTYVDIREWYVDKATMDTKPGKKGISLNCEQYQALKQAIPEIDRALP